MHAPSVYVKRLRMIRKQSGIRGVFRYFWVAFCLSARSRADARKDKKICGCSLSKYVPTPYKESNGATGSQSTHYCVLEKVYEGAEFSPSDRLIDVGCGKGRVLAFLLSRKFPGQLYGVELTEEVAEFCRKWTEKYDNVTVYSGNAFDLDYNDYTVLNLCRPFLPDMFLKFVEKLEDELVHPIRLFYWVDQESGDLLNDRPGWTMQRRETLYKIHGIPAAGSVQRYSVWTYTPQTDKLSDADR